ncbi:MAG: hypothetical protein WC477_01725 [Patescibacteria group bacterium]
MTIRSTALISILALLLGAWDASAVSFLPGWLMGFRLMIPAIVALTIFSSRRVGLLAAVVGGCVTSLLFASSGGWIPLRYVICVMLVYELSHRIITNRSLFGVMTLAGIAALADWLLAFLFHWLTSFFTRGINPEAHGPILAEIVWSAFVVGIVFIVIAAFTRRFLPTVSPYSGRRR